MIVQQTIAVELKRFALFQLSQGLEERFEVGFFCRTRAGDCFPG